MKARRPVDLAPLGAFEEQILLAVLRTGRNAFAMSIRRELEAVTGRTIAIGSVYVTLDRLESKGLIVSDRESRDGLASRRVFAVTPAGTRVLSDTRAMRDRLWTGVRLTPRTEPKRG